VRVSTVPLFLIYVRLGDESIGVSLALNLRSTEIFRKFPIIEYRVSIPSGSLLTSSGDCSAG